MHCYAMLTLPCAVFNSKKGGSGHCFVRDLCKKAVDGRFDTTSDTSKRESSIGLDISVYLHSNVEAFECGTNGGAFVDEKSESSVGASDSNKLTVFVVEVGKKCEHTS